MREITVREMQFDHLDAGALRALRGRDKIRDRSGDSIGIERERL